MTGPASLGHGGDRLAYLRHRPRSAPGCAVAVVAPWLAEDAWCDLPVRYARNDGDGDVNCVRDCRRLRGAWVSRRWEVDKVRGEGGGGYQMRVDWNFTEAGSYKREHEGQTRAQMDCNTPRLRAVFQREMWWVVWM